MNKSTTQPSRSRIKPDGATHWGVALVNCFFRIDGNDVYNHRGGKWHLLDRTTPPRRSLYHPMPVDPVLHLLDGLIELNPIVIPPGSERVLTVDGPATRLLDQKNAYIPDINPYGFEPVYYYQRDILAETCLVYVCDEIQACKECGRNYHDLDLKEAGGKCPSDACPSNH